MTSNNQKVAKGELVFTSFLLALSLVVLWDGFTLKESGINAVVGPRVFELGIGGLLFVLASLQVIAVLRGDRGTPHDIEGGAVQDSANWKSLLAIIIAIAYHILTIETLGFILATIPVFVTIGMALGEKRWVKLLLTAIPVVVITYFVFTRGLQIELPAGFEFLQDASAPAPESTEETW